ncbi:hypothetical protein J11TS1_35680 [Oceanobacillus sp. J11TS1]|nr:hypothetical protein J11TS1_35680 [Oceanobacillus sp. J11TS1]
MRKHGETYVINLTFSHKDDWDLISKYSVKQIPAIYKVEEKDSILSIWMIQKLSLSLSEKQLN